MLMINKSVTGSVVQMPDAPLRQTDVREAPLDALVSVATILDKVSLIWAVLVIDRHHRGRGACAT